MFERFTDQARQVIVLAQDEARALKHAHIGTEHILLGLLRDDEGVAARVLASLEVSLFEARAQVARIVGQGDARVTGQIPFTPRAKKVLELALREAISLGDNFIGSEHILLGLVREHEGIGARVLLDSGVGPDAVDQEVIRARSGQPSKPHVPPYALHARHLLLTLDQAWARLVEEQRFDAAARLREQQRRVNELFAEIQADLEELEPNGPPPSARGDEAARWEYAVKVLEGPAQTWPQQFGEWRRDGWEPVTVTASEGVQQVVLERRT
jgi:ATP-dependent Clp protease ATP-binding subunit ClpA